MTNDRVGRHPTHQEEIHWITTGPGSAGDWVTDEELEDSSQWLKDHKENQNG